MIHDANLRIQMKSFEQNVLLALLYSFFESCFSWEKKWKLFMSDVEPKAADW